MGLYSSTVAVIDDKPQNASESGWPHCQGGQLRLVLRPPQVIGGIFRVSRWFPGGTTLGPLQKHEQSGSRTSSKINEGGRGTGGESNMHGPWRCRLEKEKACVAVLKIKIDHQIVS
jgi:hypothetical protein